MKARKLAKAHREGYNTGYRDGYIALIDGIDALREVNKNLLAELSEQRLRVKSEYHRGVHDGKKRSLHMVQGNSRGKS